jgi:hypothetical protein
MAPASVLTCTELRSGDSGSGLSARGVPCCDTLRVEESDVVLPLALDASLRARGPHANATAPTHNSEMRNRDFMRLPGAPGRVPRCEPRRSQTCGSRTYQLEIAESTSGVGRK